MNIVIQNLLNLLRTHMNIWTNPAANTWLPEKEYEDLKKAKELLKKEKSLQGLDIPQNQQVGGDHYTKLEIQPWEYIEANKLDFWEGNVVKYITRKKGNRLEDLRKAKHYIDYLIERELK